MKSSEIQKARPISLPSTFTANVDIIIPYHGQYELMTSLVQSIFRVTRSNYYEICVVDDGSPNAAFFETLNHNANKNAERRKTTSNFKAIRLPEQVGFAGALKAGFEATQNPYVCFINSDCLIEDSNWLRAMGECLLSLKDQGVRMVAPVTNNPVDGHPAQQGDRFKRDPEPVVLDSDEFLTMYCFMCHRELFSRCGGFLKEYPYGYFEDQEFAARMNKHGFKQAVCRSSWVHHEGMATIVPLWRSTPQAREVMEVKNRERCIDDMKSLRKNG